jgi:hypothetical protein
VWDLGIVSFTSSFVMPGSHHFPPPVSPVKWKEYSLSHHTNPSSIPPSRDSLPPKPQHTLPVRMKCASMAHLLQPHKKEMIEDLRTREENRAARFKLRSILIQELTVKLGS